MTFDITKFKKDRTGTTRYDKRISYLREKSRYTNAIEQAVTGALNNILTRQTRSFVIYGEPQSGKTEMMIALTAKLLDSEFKIIILLLNDNVELLSQNLDRFISSGIDPTPRNFSEILDPDIKIGDKEWIIFCKKNTRDLEKTIEKIAKFSNKVVIDDEADYASPNSKVNKGEKTRINHLVEKLLGKDGIYIGVTATPARLDVNKTFENQNERWIDFPSHPDYTGQEVFFPATDNANRKFSLQLLPDTGDDPKYLRTALFRYLINVARLNTGVNVNEQNYSILIHTSGKKSDHSVDYKIINKLLETLRDESDAKYVKYVQEIWELARVMNPNKEEVITNYIINNISKHKIVVMNSDSDKNITDYKHATNPSSLFTIVIGGNIISRGVTFNNLLSMFFTRDTKHKIQQDTYIQRARMFGNRGAYLQYFELCIPQSLYLDWQKCFVFHKLSLAAIRDNKGTPVWLEDSRVSAVSSASIDRTAVAINSGEMGFEVFDYTDNLDLLFEKRSNDNLKLLIDLKKYLSDNSLPSYFMNFVNSFLPRGNDSIAVYSVRHVRKDTEYHDTLERAKGIFGSEDIKKYPDANHHIMIVKNTLGKARVIYKYVPNVRMLKRV